MVNKGSASKEDQDVKEIESFVTPVKRVKRDHDSQSDRENGSPGSNLPVIKTPNNPVKATILPQNGSSKQAETPTDRRSFHAAKLASYASPTVAPEPTEAKDSVWPPEGSQWDFVRPKFIKDLDKRSPNDEDYDPSTLYVPPSFLKQQTEAQKQWWQIKSQNFDTVLFFKVGKFYELFHMDAVIGIEKLGCIHALQSQRPVYHGRAGILLPVYHRSLGFRDPGQDP